MRRIRSLAALCAVAALLMATAPDAFAQGTLYEHGSETYGSLTEAEAAMRASHGAAGQYLELLNVQSLGGEITRTYAIRVHDIQVEPFSWQPYQDVPSAGIEACEFTGPIVTASNQNDCNTSIDWTSRQEQLFASRDCSSPPPEVQIVPALQHHSVGGGSAHEFAVRQFFAGQLGISIDRIWGVLKTVGLYQSYSFGADCEQRFEREPSQDCAPNTTCLPGPSLRQSLLGICPEGLTAGNRSPFEPGVITFFPKSCTLDIRDSIRILPVPGSTDDPFVQSNGDCVGNPCDVISGDKLLFERIVDLPELSLELTYHSLATTPTYSRLGPNWRHNYDSVILDTGSSSWDKTLISPAGKISAFEEDPATPGTFRPLLESNGLLRAVSNTEFHYLPGDHRKLVYTNRNGGDRHFLASITDLRSGKVVSIDRNANWVATSVSATSGRQLDLVYDEEAGNRLQSIRLGGTTLATFTYTELSPAEPRLDTIQFVDGTIRRYSYSDPRFPLHITGIIDENGNDFASYAYHADGKARSSERAGGADRVTLDYQPGETVVGLPLGSERIYELSRAASNGLTRRDRIVEGDLVTQFLFDSQRPTLSASEIDPNGNRTDVTFDDWNRTVRVVSGVATPEVVVTEMDWNDTHNRPSQVRVRDATDTVVQQIDFAYDDEGRTLSRTESDPSVADSSRTTTYTYYEMPAILAGLLRNIDGPRDIADTTTYTYRMQDAPAGEYRAGDLHTITNGVGHQIEYLAYDIAGRPVEIRSPNGSVTTLSYHPRGQLAGSSRAGEIFVYDYDDVGNLETVTEPDGATVTYTYDDAHRLVGIADALGNSVTFMLDAAGNRTSEESKDPSGVVRRSLGRTFDELGRLRALLDHNDIATSLTYDHNGNLETVTDPVGRFSRFTYDSLDRLAKFISSTGPTTERQTEIAYDVRGRIRTVTDPRGNATTYDRNGVDSLLVLDSPDAGVTEFRFDKAGNLVARTDARNEVATYTHDAIGRLTGAAYESDSRFDTTFTYDEGTNGIEQLTSMSDGISGTTTWSFDAHGRVIRKVQTPIGGPGLVVSYGYRNGRLSTITYPSGTVLAYRYDAAGQPAGVDRLDGLSKHRATTPIITQVDYLPNGPVSRVDYAQSVAQDRLYDLDFDPAGFVGGLARTYLTNAAGEITRTSVPGRADHAYAYDKLGRIARVESPPGQSVSFWDYDLSGNLINRSGQTFSVDNDSNQLTGTFQTSFTYDAMGNLSERTQALVGSLQMTYGPNQRLVHFARNGHFTTAAYRYNGFGQRVGKTVTTLGIAGNGIETKQFLYDESERLLGEYDEQGRLIMEYHWLGDLLVGLHQPGAFFQVYTDHLGTPREVRDKSNVVVWKWESLAQPYGRSVPNADPDRDGKTFTLNLRFPGQYFDAESGFHYNYFRDYDPVTGRYIQSDPIGLAGGINPYAYAELNPLGLIDRRGLRGGGASTTARPGGTFGGPGRLRIDRKRFTDGVADLLDSSLCDFDPSRCFKIGCLTFECTPIPAPIVCAIDGSTDPFLLGVGGTPILTGPNTDLGMSFFTEDAECRCVRGTFVQ